MRRKFHQLELNFLQHGGKRKGAGRKPKNAEPGMPHRQRAKKKRNEALLVTVKIAEGLPSLRRGGALKLALAALSASSNRHGMRIVQKSRSRYLACSLRGFRPILREKFRLSPQLIPQSNLSGSA